MGTRSTITFYVKVKENIRPICCIYQMHDGYIEGVGYELADWLCKKTLINGISAEEGYANGVSCLVGQFIKDHKVGIGNLYVVPIDYEKKWIIYNYKVVIQDGEGRVNDLTNISITYFDKDKIIFSGSPEELLKYKEHDKE